ncbi:MAG: lysozyme [Ornithinibacter sp.]
MKASAVAVDVIVKFEGLKLDAYLDPAGKPTIGYGTTVYPEGHSVKIGDGISTNEAHEYLAFDVDKFSAGVSRQVTGLNLNQNQFDALVSFSYNVGLRALGGSTLLKKLKAGDKAGAAAQFPRWNKAVAGGVKKVLPGLVKRRAAEQALFLKAPAPAFASVAATLIGLSTQPGDFAGATHTPSAAAIAGKNYLLLTRTADKDDKGLTLLRLAYVKNGQKKAHILVYSGTPRHQVFRKGSKSQLGSLEPLPEGRWFVHDILWRDGRDNYKGKVFSAALGPVTIKLDYETPGTTARRAIEMHIDANRARNPGTAGCIGVRSVTDYKTLVTWLRDTNPRGLFVDHGLGTCPTP